MSIHINHNDRVLITRLDTNKNWVVITNPRWGYFERACSMILNNEFNKYVEYENCGVTHRMVRYKDLENYNINQKDILPEYTCKKDHM